MKNVTLSASHHKTHLRVYIVLFIITLCLISFDAAFAQTGQGRKFKKFRVNGKSIKHISRTNKDLTESAPCPRLPNRSVDGTCNNISSTEGVVWGASDIDLYRDMQAAYGLPDSYNDMAGNCRLSPRAISNIVVAQSDDLPSPRGLSSLVFTWGQFIDHDIDLTPEGDSEYVPILLPSDEALFTLPIPFLRSEPAVGSGINYNREQQNLITSWLDASQVYGSEETRSNWLRTFNQGKLKTSSGDLLPYNTDDGSAQGTIDPDAPSMAGDGGGTTLVFVAGDVRANEQPGLTSLHTLFVREHNRICDQLVNQGLNNDEQIYQQARKLVGGYIQAITYRGFLPALGINIPQYDGYDDSVHPDITNMFATAAYRLGHTMVTEEIPVINSECEPVGSGSIALLDGFFNPSVVVDYGIAPLLQGLASQTQQKVDAQIVDNLRNFLFPVPGSPDPFGLDLASLNIQRGRDHGLPDYNSVRAFYTNQPASDFSDITSDPDLQAALEEAYGNVYDMDLWVGMLAEDHLNNSSVGLTLQSVLGKQFSELRDGDYYYYLNDPAFSSQQKDQIRNTNLREIIERNTDIDHLQNNVFFSDDCQVSGGGGGGGGGHGGPGHGHGGNLNEPDPDNKNEVKRINEVSISPNPSNGEFIVNVLLEEVSEQVLLTIRNVAGGKIYEERVFLNGKTLNSKIDLSDLDSGIYFISIKTRNEILSKKIVIE